MCKPGRGNTATVLLSALCFGFGCGRCTAQQPVAKPRLIPERAYYVYVDEADRMLSVVDGDLWWRSPAPVADGGAAFRREFPPAPDIRVVSSVWEYDGDHFRVWLSEDRRSHERGILPAHDALLGYYLTADYSTVPPRVVLTKQPTDASHWRLETIESPRSQAVDKYAGQKYVRNVNAQNVDAWLYWEEFDFRRPYTAERHVTILRRPTLSYDKKTVVVVRVYKELESK